ncbi:hypothetical protein [Glycocaulis sp.]|uniref:hypothetical protein n=1 Tax=Glycocaulis sp. TaxID=1969725 RepID=UPI003D1B5FAA
MAVSPLRAAVRKLLPKGARIWLIKFGRALRRLPGSVIASVLRLLPARAHISKPLIVRLAREGRWDVLGNIADASAALGSRVDVNALARMALAECEQARGQTEPPAIKGLVALCRPRPLNLLSPAILPHIAVALGHGRGGAATRAASAALARYAHLANPDPFSGMPAFARLPEAKQTALLLALAHHLQGLGHDDQAIAALGRALEMFPASRRIRFRLALAHLRAGRAVEAANVLFAGSGGWEHLTNAEAHSIMQLPSEGGFVVALAAELARRRAFQPAARVIAASAGRIEPNDFIQALGGDARCAELVGRLGAGLVVWDDKEADTSELAKAFLGEAEIRLIDALTAQGDLHSPESVTAVAEYREMPHANQHLARELVKWGAFRASEFLGGMKGTADPVMLTDLDPERCIILSQTSISAEFDSAFRAKFGLRIFTLGLEPWVADQSAVHRVADHFPVIASEGDLSAVHEAAKEARRISSAIIPNDVSEYMEQARSEVFELALEDALVTSARTRSALKSIVDRWGIDQVVVAVTGPRYHQSLAFAEWLESGLGLSVWVIYGGSRDGMANFQRMLAGEQDAQHANETQLIDLSAQDLLGAIVGDDSKGAVVLDDVEQNIPHDGRTSDVLLLAVLSDPSYRLCAEELLAEFQHHGKVDAISLRGDEGAEKYTDGKVRMVCLESHVQAKKGGIRYSHRDVALVREIVRADIEAGFHTLARISLAQIEKFLTVRLPQITKEVTLIHRFVRKGKHKVIIAPGRHIAARSVILWGNREGLLTVDVQAFFISAHPRYRRSLAQVYCGTIEEQISLYRDNMDPPATQKVLRIGSMPIAYKTRSVAGLSVSEARARHELPQEVKLVMFAAQHGAAEADMEIIRELADALRDSPDAMFLIKLHPRSPEAYKHAVERLTAGLLPAERLRVVRTPDIYELIVASDLVVTQFSNVGLEAAVLDRQTLSVNLTGAGYPIDLHEMGISERALSAQELRTKVLSLLHDERAIAEAIDRRAAFFERNPEVKRGDGAKKISALIFGDRVPADKSRKSGAGYASVNSM